MGDRKLEKEYFPAFRSLFDFVTCNLSLGQGKRKNRLPEMLSCSVLWLVAGCKDDVPGQETPYRSSTTFWGRRQLGRGLQRNRGLYGEAKQEFCHQTDFGLPSLHMERLALEEVSLFL